MPDNNAPQSEAYAMLSAMIETQKRVVSTIEKLGGQVHHMSVEMERVARGQTQVRADVSIMRNDLGAMRDDFEAMRNDLQRSRLDVTSRFEAVGARFDDSERGLDRVVREIQDARSEIVSQHMETPNAVQAAVHVRLQLGELAERVEALEAKL